jgi:hypothetical protein
MRYASDHIRDIELEDRAAASIAWAVGKNTRYALNAWDHMNAAGYAHYKHFTKAATEPHTVDDLHSDDILQFTSAFLGMVVPRTLLGRLEGSQEFGLTQGARLLLGTVTARVVAEAELKPIGRLSFDVAGPASKITGEIVATREAVRSVDAKTIAGIRDALVAATVTASDVFTVDAVTAGSANPSTGVGDLLSAISGGSPARPYLVGGFDTLVPLAGTLADLRSLGVGILATPAAAGKLIAIDASGLLVSDEGASISIARHASILMSDDGTDVGSPGPTTVNLWQADLEALRCERFLRLPFRPAAIAWAAVGSPGA